MILSKKGALSIEVLMVLIISFAALIGFGGYIQRAIAGRWKTSGDIFGQGRQYDPRGFGINGENSGTLNCFFDQDTGHWIDEECYFIQKCDCTLLRADGTGLPGYDDKCTNCKKSCWKDGKCNPS